MYQAIAASLPPAQVLIGPGFPAWTTGSIMTFPIIAISLRRPVHGTHHCARPVNMRFVCSNAWRVCALPSGEAGSGLKDGTGRHRIKLALLTGADL